MRKNGFGVWLNLLSFDDTVPPAFWKLLALYSSSNTIGSISWAISFGDREVQTMLGQAKDVLAWYDGMRNPVPSWYSKYRRMFIGFLIQSSNG